MPDIFTDQKKEEQAEKRTFIMKGNLGLFSAYSKHPAGISFVNQDPGEHVIVFVRHHFITNFPWIATTILFLLIPIIFFQLNTIFPLIPSAIPLGLIICLTLFYYLIVLGYALNNFIYWFYNIGVVTEKRIVDLDLEQILSHNSATANLGEVVDVKFTQRGFFQSFFNFGDIHIQTEALRANFEFLKCPKPIEVTDIINDLRVEQKGKHHANS